MFNNKKLSNAIVIFFGFIAFLLPATAKTVSSLISYEKKSEVAAILPNIKYALAFDLELDDEIVNFSFFSSKILSVKGTLLILFDISDHKKFRVVFDHRFTDMRYLTGVIEQLINNPETYKEETHEEKTSEE